MTVGMTGPHKDHKITWNVECIAAHKITAVRKDPQGDPLFVLAAKPGLDAFGEDFFWCEDCQEYVFPDDFVDTEKFGEGPYEWQLG